MSGYALGVVVGTFTVAQFAGRWPRRTVLVVLLLIGAMATAASAVLPTFEGVLAARVIAALPHGAYFGVASLVAASLMAPGRRASGIAFVLSGLTVATLVGVPAFTALGQLIGWRATFGIVAGMFVVAAVAVAVTSPSQPGDPGASLRRELGSLRNGLVWLTFGISAIGFGGLFAVYSYAAPMTTQITGLSPAVVPLSLAAIGAGMVLGNIVGGRLADRDVRLSLYAGFVGVLVALAAILLTARTSVGLMIGLFLLGTAAMSLSPTTQTRMLDVLPTSPALAGALNQAAINLGNSLGAFAGGAVIAAGFGYLSPAWAGMILATAGIALAWAGFAVESRRRRSGRPAVPARQG